MGWPKVKICVDTNVLVRAVVRDDKVQSKLAIKVLTETDLIAIPLTCLCEFVWVLLKLYRFETSDIAAAIRALVAAENVQANRPAVEFGLSVLHNGGDFAGGVLAYEGAWLGGETFVSFDKKAVALVKAQGQTARLL